MDDYFGDSFENYNLLYEKATFEHFVNHDPQPRKCSEILNCDINKFMFICSQCDNEFEIAEDYYIHQLLEHQAPNTQIDAEQDTWYERELLEEFLEPSFKLISSPKNQPEPQLKEFYESLDKIIDVEDNNLAASIDNSLLLDSCENADSNISTDDNSIASTSSSPNSINISYSNDKQNLDHEEDSPSVDPLSPLDCHRNQEFSSEDATTISGKKTSPTRKNGKKKKRTPGQCDVCNRSFNDTYNLRIHKMIHTGEMPFQCEDCGKGFRQYNKLKIHSIIHTNNKPFICDICEKGFRFRNYLAIHKRLHTGEKPYKCKLCEEHFHSMHNRRLHVKSTHLQKKDDLKCKYCEKTLSTKFYLQVHMRRHNQRNFKCEDCDQAFYSLAQLKEHVLSSHVEDKTYQCEICLAKFLRKAIFTKHMKIHLQEGKE